MGALQRASPLSLLAALSCAPAAPSEAPLDPGASAGASGGAAGSGGASAGAGGASAGESGAGQGDDGFTLIGDVPLSGEGVTDFLKITLDPPGGGLWIRASLAGQQGQGGPIDCFQIDAVSDAAGGGWVPPATSADWGPYCTTCAQRASVGRGYGLFGFPNDGHPLAPAGWVRLRVGLRSCASLLPADPVLDGAIPAAVRVEVRRTPAPIEGARGRLRLALAFAAGGQFASAAQGEALAGALSGASALFDAMKIDLKIDRSADFSPGSERITFRDDDRAPLDDLAQRARAALSTPAPAGRELLVIFAPCFAVQDPILGTTSEPDGLTPQIPGGFAVGGHADAVFIKGAPCAKGAAPAYWSAGALQKILLHELGHFLGLYHSTEANGQTDHLDDTDEDNLMHHAPLTLPSPGFSLQQIAVLRAHPYVEYP